MSGINSMYTVFKIFHKGYNHSDVVTSSKKGNVEESSPNDDNATEEETGTARVINHTRKTCLDGLKILQNIIEKETNLNKLTDIMVLLAKAKSVGSNN